MTRSVSGIGLGEGPQTPEDDFHLALKEKMREMSRDMEWSLLHVESTVAPSMEAWQAKPWWKRAFWRCKWFVWGKVWGARRWIAMRIYPDCTCDHEEWE